MGGHTERRTRGRKVVYCYAPARWLYQAEPIPGSTSTTHGSPTGTRSFLTKTCRCSEAKRSSHSTPTTWAIPSPLGSACSQFSSSLPHEFDGHGRRDPDHLWTGGRGLATTSRALRQMVPSDKFVGLEPGYFLCIARLLPYKNVQVVAEAVGALPGARLVIVGDGPARSDIESRRRSKRSISWAKSTMPRSVGSTETQLPSSPLPSRIMASPHSRPLRLVAHQSSFDRAAFSIPSSKGRLAFFSTRRLWRKLHEPWTKPPSTSGMKTNFKHMLRHSLQLHSDKEFADVITAEVALI